MCLLGLMLISIFLLNLQLLCVYPVISSICVDQPLRFGENCSYVCHCLEDSCEATSNSVGCKFGSCSPGYFGFPACQNACPTGTFGLNCSQNCNCEPQNLCNHINGVCIGGNKCGKDFYGAACTKIRTKMIFPPRVYSDCESLHISWPAFNSSYYIGSSNIVKYTVLFRSGSTNLSVYQSVNATSAYENNYDIKFTHNDSLIPFAFSVRADFLVSVVTDEYIVEGVPSPESSPLEIKCSALPYVSVIPNNNSVNIRWNDPQNPSIQSVFIHATLIGIGDCFSLSPSDYLNYTKTVSVGAKDIQLQLDYWRRYIVTVYGLTSRGVSTSPSTTTIMTSFENPSGPPLNLRQLSQSNQSVNVTWDNPLCSQQGGPLEMYVINISTLSSVVMPTILANSKNTPPIQINNLIPQIVYTLQVAYKNPVGFGPSSQLFISLNRSVSNQPTSLSVQYCGMNSCRLTWLPPKEGYEWGRLIEYRVFYWKQVTPNLVSNITVQANVQDCLLSQLESGVVYYAKVQSVFTYGTASSEIITFNTLTQFNIQLVNRSYSEIMIQWNFNQTASMFTISIEMIETLLPFTPVFSKRIFNLLDGSSGIHLYKISNLPASSRYRIIVDAIGTNNTSVGSSFLNAWTSPAPFQNSRNFSFNPVVPVFNGSLLVNVKFPTFSGYEGGPLNGFYIVVEKSSNTNRKRRSVLNQTQLGLSNNANIVYYSNVSNPSEIIIIGSGQVFDVSNLSIGKIGFSNPLLEPNRTYTIYAIIQSEVDGSSEIVRSPPVVFLTGSNSSNINGSSIIPTSTSIKNNQTDSNNALAIVLGILLALVLLALIGFIIYYICRKKRQSGQYVFRNYSKDLNVSFEKKPCLLPDSYAWWSVPRELGEPRYLIIDPEYGPSSTLVGTWSLNELLKTFSREYSSIPLGVKFSQSIGNLKMNLSKNHSHSSLPYDHNRVKLKQLNDSSETDYINASFIDGYMRRRAYIAAQSPFDMLTIQDFWLMIFQCNIAQIVMLTNFIEDSTLKCCQYWPEMPTRSNTNQLDSKSTSQYFGNIMVEIINRIDYPHFTVRYFIVTELSSNISQRVIHYQFYSWITPDYVQNISPCFKNVDNTVENDRKMNENLLKNSQDLFCHTSTYGTIFNRLNFIEFYYRVKTATCPEDGPLLVHCSTGLSRTGLYIAFDLLLQQVTHERVVNVAKFCSSLCKARSNIIHSMRQFTLLYDLLFEVILGGHCIVDLDVYSTYKMLCHKNTKINRSYLWEQWSVLHLYTPLFDTNKELQVALNSLNLHKNRYPEIIDLLPSERWRVRLHRTTTTTTTTTNNNNNLQTSNYINALYLDGASLLDDIILTQTPLKNTIDEFWFMVEEEQVSCIIDMQPFSYGVEEAVRYWPLRPGENISYPMFDGSFNEDIQSDYSKPHGPWLDFAGGRIQICQLGSLAPVCINPVSPKRNSNHEIYKRRLLIRQREASHLKQYSYQQFTNEKSKPREVSVFHFTGGWNAKMDVPESRIAIVRLLEKVRLERGTGPLIIHCLNGATRSGLLAVCYILAENMTRDHYVDLFHVIKMIKIRRKSILASPDQLRFVYRFLIQWIKYTLSEPLANLTVRRSGLSIPFSLSEAILKQQWEWSQQLVGHLPSDSRIVIFSHSQLPILGANHSGSATLNNDQSYRMSSRSNDSQSTHTNEDYDTTEMPILSTLYHYFNDEISANRNLGYHLQTKSIRNSFSNPYCY
ncbi:unnamed protein product [Schistosoma rodhaini]|nr:unnamed protein product [Schistosoma rodhaini]